MVIQLKTQEDNVFQRAESILIDETFTNEEKEAAKSCLSDLITEVGPPITAYPFWHPLVWRPSISDYPTLPSERNGFRHFENVIYFSQGFLILDYSRDPEIETQIDKIHSLVEKSLQGRHFTLVAEPIDTVLRRHGVKPLLVKCEYGFELEEGEKFPSSAAMRFMLTGLLEVSRVSDRSEPWDVFRQFVLGCPNLTASSPFVTRETGELLKKVYHVLLQSGAIGSESY
ncbi:MAG: hypothetical protein VX378_10385 [Pseudomonadota bacterium]|nr:hypothetical protein [Pseudomonadota bacterium]